MKYKVGDKVRIKQDVISNLCLAIKRFPDRVLTIDKIKEGTDIGRDWKTFISFKEKESFEWMLYPEDIECKIDIPIKSRFEILDL